MYEQDKNILNKFIKIDLLYKVFKGITALVPAQVTKFTKIILMIKSEGETTNQKRQKIAIKK